MASKATKDTAEQQEAEVVDLVPLQLRSWGLSSEPIRWVDQGWLPLVATIRAANHGDVSAATVKEGLDAKFPDAGYVAADVMLAHPPEATFTVGPGDERDSFNFALDADADLDLPPENVTWVFGDGDTANDSPSTTHIYKEYGTYPAHVEIAVAGTIYSTSQDVEYAEKAAAKKKT